MKQRFVLHLTLHIAYYPRLHSRQKTSLTHFIYEKKIHFTFSLL